MPRLPARPTDRDTLVSSTFVGPVEIDAQYHGNCGRCFGKVRPGDVLTRVDGEWLAQCCAPEALAELAVETKEKEPEIKVLPRGKTAKDICMKCFIIHANGQTECE